MTCDASQVELLVLDVDGVLTDGSIFVSPSGEELKRFNVRDGTGLSMWIRLGLPVGIITGRSGAALEARMRELGISLIYKNSKDKPGDLRTLCERTGIGPERAAFLGDDIPDLGVMKRVGYPMAVADADSRIIEISRYVTDAPGGRGAVREAVEHLLSARGQMEEGVALYD